MYKVIDENLRTYASLENLNKGIAKYGLETCSPLIVAIPGTTRLTAIFQLTSLTRENRTILDAINSGFMVV